MTKIILSGCGGKMGRVITSMVAERDNCTIAAGIDPAMPQMGYPVFPDAASVDENIEADVIVDFSHPSALASLTVLARSRKLPLVEATTGLSEEQIASVKALADTVPVFYSANMSLGVSLLTELVKQATRVLGEQFDIEIVEKHHNQKVDAPSGTALMLADAAASQLPEETAYVYDRHERREKRPKNEIGIHSVRGGTIVGEHDVIFAGQDEVVTLSHQAMSKDIFAAGAVNAAVFVAGKKPGLYSMADLVNEGVIS
ncbi:MAG: 4-hydroxy-tetrahydrodipicolinate reductase [Oscillospiraceae bacterium]